MRSMIAGVLLALLSIPLHATVIVPAEFREIVGGSELIAYGTVVDVRSEWADGRGRIESVVTVNVSSWFKGGGDPTVTFVVPGGEIGRYRSVTIGAPIFKPGDEAFLFLRARDGERPIVYGLNQGVFRVRVGVNGLRQVTTPLLMASGDAPELVKRGARERKPMPIDEFGAQLRSVVAGLRAGAR